MIGYKTDIVESIEEKGGSNNVCEDNTDNTSHIRIYMMKLEQA